MVGSHVFALTEREFVATEPNVTISLYLRDSGVSNGSLTGWSGSDENAAIPLNVGLYDLTTSSWAEDGWSARPFAAPPVGGQWIRHSRTVRGLIVGHRYAVTVAVDSYYGNRSADIDALQIEYGAAADP